MLTNSEKEPVVRVVMTPRQELVTRRLAQLAVVLILAMLAVLVITGFEKYIQLGSAGEFGRSDLHRVVSRGLFLFSGFAVSVLLVWVAFAAHAPRRTWTKLFCWIVIAIPAVILWAHITGYRLRLSAERFADERSSLRLHLVSSATLCAFVIILIIGAITLIRGPKERPYVDGFMG